MKILKEACLKQFAATAVASLLRRVVKIKSRILTFFPLIPVYSNDCGGTACGGDDGYDSCPLVTRNQMTSASAFSDEVGSAQ